MAFLFLPLPQLSFYSMHLEGRGSSALLSTTRVRRPSYTTRTTIADRMVLRVPSQLCHLRRIRKSACHTQINTSRPLGFWPHTGLQRGGTKPCMIMTFFRMSRPHNSPEPRGPALAAGKKGTKSGKSGKSGRGQKLKADSETRKERATSGRTCALPALTT